MIAAKIFNNNALATVTDEGQDAILIGLGINVQEIKLIKIKLKKFTMFKTICRRNS